MADGLVKFIATVNALPQNAWIVELGTRRWGANPTIHSEWFTPRRKITGVDYMAGEDVDVCADIHTLSTVLGAETADAVISCSTFEHLKYPQIAAHEIMKAMKVGGSLFIQTHQTFPLHAFPYDYCRFSDSALRALFPNTMGMAVVDSGMEFSATIRADRAKGAERMSAFLNSWIYAMKVYETPPTFRPDMEPA